VEKSLAHMKKEEVTKAVLSLSNYDLPIKTQEEYITFCKEVNDELKEIINKYPDHFSAFGILPFPHEEESIKELYRTQSYDFDGVILYTNVKGTYPSSVEQKKLFAAFNEKKVTLFIHPGKTPENEKVKNNAVSSYIEYPQDVSRLVSRLFAEDVFEKYPDISYVFGYGGGLFTYQFSRLGKLVYLKSKKEIMKIRWGRVIGDLVKKKSRVLDYLDRMTFDLTGITRKEQLTAIFANVSQEKCMYGSDFPYES